MVLKKEEPDQLERSSEKSRNIPQALKRGTS